jgi:hypothetical protein
MVVDNQASDSRNFNESTGGTRVLNAEHQRGPPHQKNAPRSPEKDLSMKQSPKIDTWRYFWLDANVAEFVFVAASSLGTCQVPRVKKYTQTNRTL